MAKFILSLLMLVSSFKSYSLPSEEVFIQRVVQGLNWHRDNSFCEHLTEDRMNEISSIIKEVFSLECTYQDEYFQVIVGQNSCFVAYQILLKELYKLTRGEGFSNFEFLRPLDTLYLEQNLEQFLINHPDLLNIEEVFKILKELPEEEATEKWVKIECDTTPKISSQLISGSLTLETMTPMDSALDVFIRGRGMAGEEWVPEKIPQLITEVAKSEGIEDSDLEKKLIELITKAPKTTEGILMQIFIPKNLAHNMMYIAWGGGFLDEKSSENIDKYYTELEQLRESADFSIRTPSQVRLLAGALNPQEVIIKRYTLIGSDELADFEILAHNFWKALLSKSQREG